MANQAIIARKEEVVNEITDRVKAASGVVLFDYRGLTDAEIVQLRRKLREENASYKVYKNTLTKRALDKLSIDLGDNLNGPKAIAFGKDAIAPIKVLSDFAKDHKALELKVGIVDGEVADTNMLKQLAAIPSKEGLLTMFASGLMAIPRDFAICLDLHSKNIES